MLIGIIKEGKGAAYELLFETLKLDWRRVESFELIQSRHRCWRSME